ncbi:MAG: UvrD-helicase domain-containing protein [Candidatus Jacksonbacteria bacterium]
MSILDQLNFEQQKAVRAIDGPVLVLAGAGSGKTRALTHRIVYLIHQKAVNPRQILAVTFTNKAASEMKERVSALLKDIPASPAGGQYPQCQPLIGTFHSVCARILREDISILGYSPSFTIFDTNDQISAIKHVLAQLQLSTKDFNPKVIAKIIEKAKREMISSDEFKLGDSFDDRIARVYRHYQKYLQEINALDFGDLLFKVNELWRKYPLILEKYQKRWHYILVDEYQDTNLAQYEFCRQLAKKHQNLFVVGDDYQSIYSFRGADLTNILNFNRDYPQARVILLEQNYRSTKSILNLANIIIKKNKAQKEKVLWTLNKKGVLPQVLEVEDEQEEAEFIINKLANKINLNNFVVLYRTNAQSRALEEVLLYHNAPYRIIGGIRFYDRKEIKDILAYLRVLGNPRDFVNLGRIINTPSRGIGSATLQELFRYMQNKGMDVIQTSMSLLNQKPLELSESVYKKVRPFCLLMRDLIKKLPNLTVSQLVETVAQKSNYLDYLKSAEENFEERLENIKELKTVAQRFSDFPGADGLRSFLEEIALMADIDALDERQNAVTLMTVHAVKGLEFDHVFMVGMEQGLFPHAASLFNKADVEEERRLCYVGITRARQSLYLIHARGRTIYGSTSYQEPSEFIADLDDDVVERIIL